MDDSNEEHESADMAKVKEEPLHLKNFEIDDEMESMLENLEDLMFEFVEPLEGEDDSDDDCVLIEEGNEENVQNSGDENVRNEEDEEKQEDDEGKEEEDNEKQQEDVEEKEEEVNQGGVEEEVDVEENKVVLGGQEKFYGKKEEIVQKNDNHIENANSVVENREEIKKSIVPEELEQSLEDHCEDSNKPHPSKNEETSLEIDGDRKVLAPQKIELNEDKQQNNEINSNKNIESTSSFQNVLQKMMDECTPISSENELQVSDCSVKKQDCEKLNCIENNSNSNESSKLSKIQRFVSKIEKTENGDVNSSKVVQDKIQVNKPRAQDFFKSDFSSQASLSAPSDIDDSLSNISDGELNFYNNESGECTSSEDEDEAVNALIDDKMFNNKIDSMMNNFEEAGKKKEVSSKCDSTSEKERSRRKEQIIKLLYRQIKRVGENKIVEDMLAKKLINEHNRDKLLEIIRYSVEVRKKKKRLKKEKKKAQLQKLAEKKMLTESEKKAKKHKSLIVDAKKCKRLIVDCNNVNLNSKKLIDKDLERLIQQKQALKCKDRDSLLHKEKKERKIKKDKKKDRSAKEHSKKRKHRSKAKMVNDKNIEFLVKKREELRIQYQNYVREEQESIVNKSMAPFNALSPNESELLRTKLELKERIKKQIDLLMERREQKKSQAIRYEGMDLKMQVTLSNDSQLFTRRNKEELNGTEDVKRAYPSSSEGVNASTSQGPTVSNRALVRGPAAESFSEMYENLEKKPVNKKLPATNSSMSTNDDDELFPTISSIIEDEIKLDPDCLVPSPPPPPSISDVNDDVGTKLEVTPEVMSNLKIISSIVTESSTVISRTRKVISLQSLNNSSGRPSNLPVKSVQSVVTSKIGSTSPSPPLLMSSVVKPRKTASKGERVSPPTHNRNVLKADDNDRLRRKIPSRSRSRSPKSRKKKSSPVSKKVDGGASRRRSPSPIDRHRSRIKLNDPASKSRHWETRPVWKKRSRSRSRSRSRERRLPGGLYSPPRTTSKSSSVFPGKSPPRNSKLSAVRQKLKEENEKALLKLRETLEKTDKLAEITVQENTLPTAPHSSFYVFQPFNGSMENHSVHSSSFQPYESTSQLPAHMMSPYQTNMLEPTNNTMNSTVLMAQPPALPIPTQEMRFSGHGMLQGPQTPSINTTGHQQIATSSSLDIGVDIPSPRSLSSGGTAITDTSLTVASNKGLKDNFVETAMVLDPPQTMPPGIIESPHSMNHPSPAEPSLPTSNFNYFNPQNTGYPMNAFTGPMPENISFLPPTPKTDGVMNAQYPDSNNSVDMSSFTMYPPPCPYKVVHHPQFPYPIPVPYVEPPTPVPAPNMNMQNTPVIPFIRPPPCFNQPLPPLSGQPPLPLNDPPPLINPPPPPFGQSPPLPPLPQTSPSAQKSDTKALPKTKSVGYDLKNMIDVIKEKLDLENESNSPKSSDKSSPRRNDTIEPNTSKQKQGKKKALSMDLKNIINTVRKNLALRKLQSDPSKSSEEASNPEETVETPRKLKIEFKKKQVKNKSPMNKEVAPEFLKDLQDEENEQLDDESSKSVKNSDKLTTKTKHDAEIDDSSTDPKDKSTKKKSDKESVQKVEGEKLKSKNVDKTVLMQKQIEMLKILSGLSTMISQDHKGTSESSSAKTVEQASQNMNKEQSPKESESKVILAESSYKNKLQDDSASRTSFSESQPSRNRSDKEPLQNNSQRKIEGEKVKSKTVDNTVLMQKQIEMLKMLSGFGSRVSQEHRSTPQNISVEAVERTSEKMNEEKSLKEVSDINECQGNSSRESQSAVLEKNHKSVVDGINKGVSKSDLAKSTPSSLASKPENKNNSECNSKLMDPRSKKPVPSTHVGRKESFESEKTPIKLHKSKLEISSTESPENLDTKDREKYHGSTFKDRSGDYQKKSQPENELVSNRTKERKISNESKEPLLKTSTPSEDAQTKRFIGEEVESGKTAPASNKISREEVLKQLKLELAQIRAAEKAAKSEDLLKQFNASSTKTESLNESLQSTRTVLTTSKPQTSAKPKTSNSTESILKSEDNKLKSTAQLESDGSKNSNSNPNFSKNSANFSKTDLSSTTESHISTPILASQSKNMKFSGNSKTLNETSLRQKEESNQPSTYDSDATLRKTNFKPNLRTLTLKVMNEFDPVIRRESMVNLEISPNKQSSDNANEDKLVSNDSGSISSVEKDSFIPSNNRSSSVGDSPHCESELSKLGSSVSSDLKKNFVPVSNSKVNENIQSKELSSPINQKDKKLTKTDTANEEDLSKVFKERRNSSDSVSYSNMQKKSFDLSSNNEISNKHIRRSSVNSDGESPKIKTPITGDSKNQLQSKTAGSNALSNFKKSSSLISNNSTNNSLASTPQSNLETLRSTLQTKAKQISAKINEKVQSNQVNQKDKRPNISNDQISKALKDRRNSSDSLHSAQKKSYDSSTNNEISSIRRKSSDVLLGKEKSKHSEAKTSMKDDSGKRTTRTSLDKSLPKSISSSSKSFSLKEPENVTIVENISARNEEKKLKCLKTQTSTVETHTKSSSNKEIKQAPSKTLEKRRRSLIEISSSDEETSSLEFKKTKNTKESNIDTTSSCSKVDSASQNKDYQGATNISKTTSKKINVLDKKKISEVNELKRLLESDSSDEEIELEPKKCVLKETPKDKAKLHQPNVESKSEMPIAEKDNSTTKVGLMKNQYYSSSEKLISLNNKYKKFISNQKENLIDDCKKTEISKDNVSAMSKPSTCVEEENLPKTTSRLNVGKNIVEGSSERSDPSSSKPKLKTISNRDPRRNSLSNNAVPINDTIIKNDSDTKNVPNVTEVVLNAKVVAKENISQNDVSAEKSLKTGAQVCEKVDEMKELSLTNEDFHFENDSSKADFSNDTQIQSGAIATAESNNSNTFSVLESKSKKSNNRLAKVGEDIFGDPDSNESNNSFKNLITNICGALEETNNSGTLNAVETIVRIKTPKDAMEVVKETLKLLSSYSEVPKELFKARNTTCVCKFSDNNDVNLMKHIIDIKKSRTLTERKLKQINKKTKLSSADKDSIDNISVVSSSDSFDVFEFSEESEKSKFPIERRSNSSLAFSSESPHQDKLQLHKSDSKNFKDNAIDTADKSVQSNDSKSLNPSSTPENRVVENSEKTEKSVELPTSESGTFSKISSLNKKLSAKNEITDVVQEEISIEKNSISSQKSSAKKDIEENSQSQSVDVNTDVADQNKTDDESQTSGSAIELFLNKADSKMKKRPNKRKSKASEVDSLKKLYVESCEKETVDLNTDVAAQNKTDDESQTSGSVTDELSLNKTDNNMKKKPNKRKSKASEVDTSKKLSVESCEKETVDVNTDVAAQNKTDDESQTSGSVTDELSLNKTDNNMKKKPNKRKSKASEVDTSKKLSVESFEKETVDVNTDVAARNKTDDESQTSGSVTDELSLNKTVNNMKKKPNKRKSKASEVDTSKKLCVESCEKESVDVNTDEAAQNKTDDESQTSGSVNDELSLNKTDNNIKKKPNKRKSKASEVDTSEKLCVESSEKENSSEKCVNEGVSQASDKNIKSSTSSKKASSTTESMDTNTVDCQTKILKDAFLSDVTESMPVSKPGKRSKSLSNEKSDETVSNKKMKTESHQEPVGTSTVEEIKVNKTLDLKSSGARSSRRKSLETESVDEIPKESVDNLNNKQTKVFTEFDKLIMEHASKIQSKTNQVEKLIEENKKQVLLRKKRLSKEEDMTTDEFTPSKTESINCKMDVEDQDQALMTPKIETPLDSKPITSIIVNEDEVLWNKISECLDKSSRTVGTNVTIVKGKLIGFESFESVGKANKERDLDNVIAALMRLRYQRENQELQKRL